MRREGIVAYFKALFQHLSRVSMKKDGETSVKRGGFRTKDLTHDLLYTK